MPVAPGRNLSILIEVAARNQLLRLRGHHAARKLAEWLDRHVQQADAHEQPPRDPDDDADPGASP